MAARSRFSRKLNDLRLRSGKSVYRLAQLSDIDQGYLHRLESGARTNPTRDMVIKISLALAADCSAITINDLNELLMESGYAPLRGRGEPILEE